MRCVCECVLARGCTAMCIWRVSVIDRMIKQTAMLVGLFSRRILWFLFYRYFYDQPVVGPLWGAGQRM